jgi:hypothetical protein
VTGAVLVKGQNVAVDALRVVVTVAPRLALSALLVDADGRARTSAHLLTVDHQDADGVRWSPFALEVDTRAVAPAVHAVLCVVTVDPDQSPVTTVRDARGAELATFTADDLTTERAVVVVELYRRAGGWRLRAVGQGYDGGLVAAAADHGITTSAPAAPPPTDLDDERVPQRVRAVWEDAARSTVAYVSACTYAEHRRDAEVSAALADPARRTSPATDAARARAESRHDELVARADAEHDRDVDTLTGELAALQAVLPAAVADWASPAWGGWSAPPRLGSAVRLGTVHADLAPQLRIPLLTGLPLRAPLWVDTAGADPPSTARAVRALVLRLLAAHPAGGLRLRLVDLVGGLAGAVGSTAVTAGAAELGAELDALVDRVEMVQLARRAGGGLEDTAGRLLVVHGLPHGLGDHTLEQLLVLARTGAPSGVHLLLTGDRDDLLGRDATRTLAQLAESAQRLPVAGDGTLDDPWVGLEWVFAPDLGPDDARAAELLRAVAGSA